MVGGFHVLRKVMGCSRGLGREWRDWVTGAQNGDRFNVEKDITQTWWEHLAHKKCCCNLL